MANDNRQCKADYRFFLNIRLLKSREANIFSSMEKSLAVIYSTIAVNVVRYSSMRINLPYAFSNAALVAVDICVNGIAYRMSFNGRGNKDMSTNNVNKEGRNIKGASIPLMD